MVKTNHKLSVKFSYNDKIIEKSGDARIYRDAILLTPGAWSDSLAGAPVEYTPSELKKSAGKWTSNYLNLDHNWSVLSRIGYVENTHWNKGVRGDLHIHPITQNAKDTITMIDAGFVNHLSVELMSEDIWKAEDEKRYATNIEFIGLGVVLHPACPDSRIIPD